MKNKFTFSLLLFFLLFSTVSFPMLKRFSKVLRSSGMRLASDGIHAFFENLDDPEPSISGEWEDFVNVVEPPIDVLQEYLPMLRAVDLERGFIKKVCCPFLSSLFNSSNEVDVRDIFYAIDFFLENESEELNKRVSLFIEDFQYNCELKVPVSVLYYATMIDMDVEVIKKLVEECHEDANFNILENIEKWEVACVKAIMSCQTPRDWAALHGNKAVMQYLDLQNGLDKPEKEILL